MADQLGAEYSTDYAYFIAGGRTLAAIESYLDDKKNSKALRAAIAQDVGALDVIGYKGRDASLVFDHAVENPALTPDDVSGAGQRYYYRPDETTPEGKALIARIDDIPDFDMTHSVFARRLMGVEEVATNPDNLQDSFGNANRNYAEGATARAASFSQYGDTYVVSVPRTVRGIFNEASRKSSEEEGYTQAAGYVYDWATPPDSQPIPYSKVVELQEREKGDQLAPRTVMRKKPAFSTKR